MKSIQIEIWMKLNSNRPESNLAPPSFYSLFGQLFFAYLYKFFNNITDMLSWNIHPNNIHQLCQRVKVRVIPAILHIATNCWAALICSQTNSKAEIPKHILVHLHKSMCVSIDKYWCGSEAIVGSVSLFLVRHVETKCVYTQT